MMSPKSILYLISQRKNNVSAATIACSLGITSRSVRRYWKRYCDTGKIPVPGIPGRPAKKIKAAVLDIHAKRPAGVVRTTIDLKEKYNISYSTVYKIMKSKNMITASPAKSRKRKWVRFERKYSNAMWHVDWHTMKDPRLKRLELVAYLDDASRCITGFGVFQHATSENSALVLRKAIKSFGTPAQILSDNGTQFTSTRRHTPTHRWTPTVFEEELLDSDIVLINSRPHHPQTNGKLERFFRTLEDELHHFDSIASFMQYYNEDRLHFSLDIHNRQTPLRAFSDKIATKSIRKSNPKWMEVDVND